MRYVQILLALMVDLFIVKTQFSIYEIMGCVIILTYNLSLIMR